MDKQKLEMLRTSANQFKNSNDGSIEGLTEGTIRRKISTLSRHLNQALDYIEANEPDHRKNDDAFDALHYGYNKLARQSMGKSINKNGFNMGYIKQNLEVLSKVKDAGRKMYGTYNGEPRWDLACNWLRMTNDQFFDLYGFNYVPSTFLRERVQTYLGGLHKWQAAEKELESGISETRMKSLDHLVSHQPLDQETLGLIKKMDQTNTSLLNSSQQTNNPTNFRSLI